MTLKALEIPSTPRTPPETDGDQHHTDADFHQTVNASHGANSPRIRYAKKKSLREATSLQLMMHMDANAVKSIQRKFVKAGGAVDLYDFVNIMRCHLPEYSNAKAVINTANDNLGSKQNSKSGTPAASEFGGDDAREPGEGEGQVIKEFEWLKNLSEEEREKELVADLVELFREVDINGDGDMEWDEFTRFIVEKASLFQDRMSLDKIPPYYHNTRFNTENIPSELRQRHTESLDSILNIARANQFAVIEAHSKVVSLYNSYNGQLVTNLVQGAVPLAMHHIPSKNALVTSCADMTLNVWNLDDTSNKKRYQLKNKWPVQSSQMSLSWVEDHNLLYSGSTMGPISAWSLQDQEEKATFRGHSDIVMEMMTLPMLNNIVSASLDTSVRLWDTYTETETNKLLGHTKGVFSLSYNEEHRFIVSAGFDHDAYIWSPFVNSLLYKLSGHSSSLVGCHCVEGTNELITADSGGLFKIWDLRNFMCVQTFTSIHEAGDLNDLSGMNSFTHLKLPAHGTDAIFNPEDDEEDYRIVCGTKRLFMFDQFRAKKEPVSDHLPITSALFNNVSLTIMTVAGKGVKIWDAVLGNIKIELNELNDCDISCACLDDRCRKFFIGDTQGSIKVHNYSNGALMKKFPSFPDQATVTDLIYCSHVKVVLAAASNGNIRIYDELDPETCIVLREFDEGYRHSTLQTIVYCHSGGIVCSAGVEEVLKAWDFETGKCLSEFCHVEETFAESDDDDDESEFDSRSRQSGSRQRSRRGSRQGSRQRGRRLSRRNSRGSNSSFSPGPKGMVIDPEETKNVPFDNADDVDVTCMACLDPYPLMAVATSDGKVAIFGMRHAHPRIRNTCFLRFENRPPPSATYGGENKEEYPQMHMPKGDWTECASPTYGSVSKRLSLRRRSSSMVHEEESDPDWVTKPRLDSPRLYSPQPVHSLVWDEASVGLFTGDESGRIRKWSLASVISELVEEGLGDKTEMIEEKGVQRYGSRRANQRSSFGRKSMQKNDMKNYLPAPELDAELVKFVWGIEAHEDSCSIKLISEENMKGLLSFSSDRTVKSWTLAGRPMGMLLTGLEPDMKNPCWDFKLDVDQRDEYDHNDANTVYDRIVEEEQRRDASFEEEKKGETNISSPGRKRTSSELREESKEETRKDQEGKGNGLRNGTDISPLPKLGSRNRCDSGLSSSSIGDDPRRHLRVLTALNDMQSMSATVKSQVVEREGDQLEDIADLERTLEKSGRESKMRVPKGFKLENMEKLEELGFQLTGPGAKHRTTIYGNNDDKDDEAQSGGGHSPGGRSASSSKLPNLPQTFRKWNPPPTIVPPVLKKTTKNSRASQESMKRLGDRLEDLSWAGSNPFTDSHSVGSGVSGGLPLVLDIEGDEKYKAGGGGLGGRNGGDEASVLSDL